jgi:alkanesulfonate monooxygenase SsuD/methylene tetrahydromethanopterin reductase-like flavin-dependent oxidoreductase (luciferase family)
MVENARVSLGIAASVGPKVAASIAPAAEDAGFHALWVNDLPGADSLALLASASGVTNRLLLATGVMPIDRRPPSGIVADVRALGLDQSRLMLGIGAGQLRSGGLRRVCEAVREMRDKLSAPVLVGALGPRMRLLAAEHADGVLLSWLTPELARAQAIEAHDAAPGVHVALYVRTALERAAVPRLHSEAARYAAVPSYAANFARESVAPIDAVWDAASRRTDAPFAAYRRGVDEIVLRAITVGDSAGDYLRFIDSAQELIRRTAG